MPEVVNRKFNTITGHINPELIMVIFIIFLLIIMLFSITFAHFLIERPKKRRMLTALRNYIKNKKEPHNTDIVKSRSLDSLHPSIIITDYSDQTKIDTNGESETLLRPSKKMLGSSPIVTFSLDEEDDNEIKYMTLEGGDPFFALFNFFA